MNTDNAIKPVGCALQAECEEYGKKEPNVLSVDVDNNRFCIGSEACMAVCGKTDEILASEHAKMTQLPKGVSPDGITNALNALEEHDEDLWKAVKCIATSDAPQVTLKGMVEKARGRVKFDCPEGDDPALASTVANAIRTARNGALYLDEQMRNIALKSAAGLSMGHHLMFYGDPGVAKTELAKHMAQAIDPDYSFVSLTAGRGDNLLEKQEIVDGSTVDNLGIIAEAASKGRVVVVEEFNSIPPEDQAQLNTVLMANEGEEITLTSGLRLVVGKGFRIIATLNPQTDNQGEIRQQAYDVSDALKARFAQHHFLPSMLYHRGAEDTEFDGYGTLLSLIMSRAAKTNGVSGIVSVLSDDNIKDTLRAVSNVLLKTQPTDNAAADLPLLASDRDVVRWFEEWNTQRALGIASASFGEFVQDSMTTDANNGLTPRQVGIVVACLEVHT